MPAEKKTLFKVNRDKCIQCGREVMLERVKVEKNIKKIIREDGE
jgi:hypothetical protein